MDETVGLGIQRAQEADGCCFKAVPGNFVGCTASNWGAGERERERIYGQGKNAGPLWDVITTSSEKWEREDERVVAKEAANSKQVS